VDERDLAVEQHYARILLVGVFSIGLKLTTVQAGKTVRIDAALAERRHDCRTIGDA
jgi:hypothetical protein